MSVKFHPVVQIKLILIQKKDNKKAHRGISSIQTVTLWDLTLIHFRSMCPGNSHHSDWEPQWCFVYLAGENWSHCAIKKHVGKYCKHCVRSDCAKQTPLCTSKHQCRSQQQCCRLPTAGNPFFYRFCTKIQVENHDTLKSP